MKLYLCGPMTGLPDHNFPAFNAAAKALRGAGYEVVNPAELNSLSDPWQQCMKKDIIALMECDGLALMPGWEASRGASLEKDIASRLNYEVAYCGTWLAAARFPPKEVPE